MMLQKRSRMDYYVPKPPIQIHILQSYLGNRTTVDAYVRDHLNRDVGGFFRAVACAVLWEAAFAEGMGCLATSGFPWLYRNLLSNLVSDRPLLKDVKWSFQKLPKCTPPTRILAYLEDRERGLTQ